MSQLFLKERNGLESTGAGGYKQETTVYIPAIMSCLPEKLQKCHLLRAQYYTMGEARGLMTALPRSCCMVGTRSKRNNHCE